MDSVFPAYAGMIPVEMAANIKSTSVPRIRGDDPSHNILTARQHVCSPHTRG